MILMLMILMLMMLMKKMLQQTMQKILIRRMLLKKVSIRQQHRTRRISFLFFLFRRQLRPFPESRKNFSRAAKILFLFCLKGITFMNKLKGEL